MVENALLKMLFNITSNKKKALIEPLNVKHKSNEKNVREDDMAYISKNISNNEPKSQNTQAYIVTKTVEFNRSSKIMQLTHPTYAIVTNYNIEELITITVCDVVLNLSDRVNNAYLILYNCLSKTISIKMIRERIEWEERLLYYYYNENIFGVNESYINYTSSGDHEFRGANEILNEILNNPFKQSVNIKLLGDSITAGVGATGYKLTTEVIGVDMKYLPDQVSNCWANKFGKRIVELFNGDKLISPTDKNIKYLKDTTLVVQKSKNCKLFGRVSCQIGLEFNIITNAFNLYFTKHIDSAIIDIKVDGVTIKTVDLYNAIEICSHKEEVTELEYGEHKVEIIYKDKNIASTSNRIIFEGIELTRNITYKNMGVSGINSKWIDFHKKDLINVHDDVIIIQIGTNDRLDFNDMASLELNLGNTIEYIKLLKKEIILLSSCPVVSIKESYASTMADVDLAIARIAKKFNITHISNYKEIINYCRNTNTMLVDLLPDLLHPGDKLYNEMYRNVANGMYIPIEPL